MLQASLKAALNVLVAAEQVLDYQRAKPEGQALKTAPTHTLVRTAGPLIMDRPLELLLSPYRRSSIGVLRGRRVCALAHLYADAPK